MTIPRRYLDNVGENSHVHILCKKFIPQLQQQPLRLDFPQAMRCSEDSGLLQC